MSDEAGDGGRPVGRIEPSTDEIFEIRSKLAEQAFEEALEEIEAFESGSGLERDWVGYFRGLALLGTRQLDEAFETFQETYDRVVTSSVEEVGEDRFRVASKCLKKMGWYHRRGRGYERAYACHSMEYDLVDEYGSNLELHDAALSLDVVSYNLQSPQISKLWLERSVEAAEQIDNEVFRVKALGLSWNNLTGTLCDLESFEEAVEAAEQSLENWERYEELESPEENRVVWAKHIMGDAYKRWGDHLAIAGDEGEAKEKLEEARDVLEAAVEEAEEREMSEEDIADINGKLEDVGTSLSQIAGGAESEEESGEDADDSAETEASEEDDDDGADESQEAAGGDEESDEDAGADEDEPEDGSESGEEEHDEEGDGAGEDEEEED